MGRYYASRDGANMKHKPLAERIRNLLDFFFFGGGWSPRNDAVVAAGGTLELCRVKQLSCLSIYVQGFRSLYLLVWQPAPGSLAMLSKVRSPMMAEANTYIGIQFWSFRSAVPVNHTTTQTRSSVRAVNVVCFGSAVLQSNRRC